VEPQASEQNPGDPGAAVTVFRGSRVDCVEFSLVLDARSVPHERVDAGGDEWLLRVPPDAAADANDELERYRAERTVRRAAPPDMVPFPGSNIGAVSYAAVLILVAYAAGVAAFGRDWFEAGAIRSQTGAAAHWWRAFTALSLHLDQEHLLGNLLFGAGIGILAGRMFGPGVAWLGIVLAGATANYADMLLSPEGHRAVGASTAVFAALGMLAGFGWGQRLKQRERRLYRWAPLFAGSCLLALLGAGNEHVDVLGHLLGFLCGILAGWLFARCGVPRSRCLRAQCAAGGVAVLLMAGAWALALR
jgi:membrane associated rhomboid family serine protease